MPNSRTSRPSSHRKHGRAVSHLLPGPYKLPTLVHAWMKDPASGQPTRELTPAKTRSVSCRFSEGLYPHRPREAPPWLALRCLHKGLSGLTKPLYHPCRLVPGNAVLSVGILWGTTPRTRTCGDSVGPRTRNSARFQGRQERLGNASDAVCSPPAGSATPTTAGDHAGDVTDA